MATTNINLLPRGEAYSRHSSNMAAPIGTMISLMISIIMATKSTGIILPGSSFIHVGVMIGASIVVTAVTVIDSGRFALAMNDMTFEARPLEQEPINTMPAATSGEKPISFAS